MDPTSRTVRNYVEHGHNGSFCTHGLDWRTNSELADLRHARTPLTGDSFGITEPLSLKKKAAMKRFKNSGQKPLASDPRSLLFLDLDRPADQAAVAAGRGLEPCLHHVQRDHLAKMQCLTVEAQGAI